MPRDCLTFNENGVPLGKGGTSGGFAGAETNPPRRDHRRGGEGLSSFTISKGGDLEVLMSHILTSGFILITLLIAACSNPKSGAGLRLPDGDVERGKAAFLELKCNTCHTVAKTEIPSPSREYAYVRVVVLGGEVRQVKTYGEQVTSLTNA